MCAVVAMARETKRRQEQVAALARAGNEKTPGQVSAKTKVKAKAKTKAKATPQAASAASPAAVNTPPATAAASNPTTGLMITTEEDCRARRY